MRYAVVVAAQAALTRIGAFAPRALIRGLASATNYLDVGRWLAKRGYQVPHRVATRFALVDELASKADGPGALVLEFGVFEGEATRRWAAALRDPGARIVGFDSFEGLPEAWSAFDRGHFSTRGALPQLSDPRVSFVAGWFQDTLPSFVMPPHQRLVVFLDADLYTSTLCVLEHLRPFLVPGTLMVLNDFHDMHNERKAFQEWLSTSGARVRLVGATRKLSHVAFEIVP